ncbi:hypothetical protein Bca52824_064398 [Brassica carinata]|uniref:Uncharacterized protein n=1 Tax=Brassica carinata TaxID=52824 RepID=A0A8X7QHE8_BRACI|nr:hypothetical protein Bca52824_064398 [Brassica carinata]
MDQPYDVLAPHGHPTFTHFPTDKQVLVVSLAIKSSTEFDETLFIYHHFVHKVMDNYGKQIHEWKKKWEINKLQPYISLSLHPPCSSRLAADPPRSSGSSGVMRVAELVQQPGRDHLP